MKNLQDNDLICYCIEVNKKTIVDAILNGNTTLQSIKDNTKACTGNECKEKKSFREMLYQSPQLLSI